MAFRRKTWKRRGARRNPYEVQRFHFCRREFQIGGASCATALTDSTFLMIPGEQAFIANGSNANIGPLIDNVSKGVVIGGMRFWCEWAINTDGFPAEWVDTVAMASLLFWIAKVPVDPETMAPAWIPDPMLPNMAGDRAQRENLLWTKLWHVPVGFNDLTTTTQILSSQGSIATRFGGGPTDISLNPPMSFQAAPYRVKTKRTLTDMDILLFGVTSVTGINSVQTAPMAVDLYGQVAVKRTSNRKTGL